MENTKATSFSPSIFEKYSVKKAIFSMVMPTIISQLILIIYNMADTWYVGLTNNANAVAAISLCLPVYNMLSAISNMFGIGGAGVLSRALGKKDNRSAAQAFAVSVYGAIIVAVIYSVVIFLFSRPLLYLIGGDDGDIEYAVNYVRWTIVIGGIPTILAPALAHLIRAAGNPGTASFGMMFGAILNIILDPLFMFVILKPGNEVIGAAIATALSNGISLLYYCIYIILKRRNGLYSLKIRKGNRNLCCLSNILRGGIPSFCMIALAMFSNCFLNSMLSEMGSEAVAGIGIVRKIDQLAYAVNQGITQGMLPLVAFYYASGKHKQMKQAVIYCAFGTFLFSLICMSISLLFAPQLVNIFIRNEATIYFGSQFLKVICLSIPIYSLTFIIITFFQAVNRGTEAFFLSFLRKGTLDIALMFFIYGFFGVSHITVATPVSEAAALCLGIIFIIRYVRKMNA